MQLIHADGTYKGDFEKPLLGMDMRLRLPKKPKVPKDLSHNSEGGKSNALFLGLIASEDCLKNMKNG